MTTKYARLGLAFGLPGLLAQGTGHILTSVMSRSQSGLALAGFGVVLGAAGTVLLLVGMAFYAKAKGQHPAWAGLAFLSVIGVAVLVLLDDNSDDGPRTGR